MRKEEPELTNEQTVRIDEVENAVFDLCKILTENDELDWNISFIGEIADVAAEIMASHGHRVRYPSIVYKGNNGNGEIVDYVEPVLQ